MRFNIKQRSQCLIHGIMTHVIDRMNNQRNRSEPNSCCQNLIGSDQCIHSRSVKQIGTEGTNTVYCISLKSKNVIFKSVLKLSKEKIPGMTTLALVCQTKQSTPILADLSRRVGSFLQLFLILSKQSRRTQPNATPYEALTALTLIMARKDSPTSLAQPFFI